MEKEEGKFPTLSLSTPDCRITLNKKGVNEYTKISFPLKYGIYSEIETKDAILQFNLNHEIIRAKGKDKKWIQPSEWLKRSMGNDWIYYSTGGYAGVFEAIGEYYLPNLQYPTNSLIGGKPFKEPSVERVVSSWQDIIKQSMLSVKNSLKSIKNSLNSIKNSSNTMKSSSNSMKSSSNSMKSSSEAAQDSPDVALISFLEQALHNTPKILQQKAEKLFETTGGRITVMPPDARHVDYDIIPLAISEGCLYKCRFCRVKTDKPFAVKSKHEIQENLKTLKEIYGRDIVNYNAVFLGDHDALNAGEETIISAAEASHSFFNFKDSFMKGSTLLLFGSVDSLMNASKKFFERLNRLPCYTYINIGLESADQKTLDILGKPITSKQVEDAFMYIQHLNKSYSRIEITSNFIMDENLPCGHYPAFLNLVREKINRPKIKGAVYLSPLSINKPSREVLFEFNRLKTLSRVPAFLYIIQRL